MYCKNAKQEIMQAVKTLFVYCKNAKLEIMQVVENTF